MLRSISRLPDNSRVNPRSGSRTALPREPEAEIDPGAFPAETVRQQGRIAVQPITRCRRQVARCLSAAGNRDLVDNIGDIFEKRAQVEIAERADPPTCLQFVDPALLRHEVGIGYVSRDPDRDRPRQ